MDYEIIWTEEATSDFDAIVGYLEGTGSERSVDLFVNTFFRKLSLLTQLPYMGVKSAKRPEVRRLVISKNYSLIYVVIVDQIYLLRVYDNRSNPASMEF